MKLWDMMNDNEYQLNGQQVRITMPAPDDQLYTQLVVIGTGDPQYENM